MAAVAGFSLALSDWEEAAGVDSPQKKARRFRLCLLRARGAQRLSGGGSPHLRKASRAAALAGAESVRAGRMSSCF